MMTSTSTMEPVDDRLKNAHRCLVILPTYNERSNIGVMIEAILLSSNDVDVLVVDDSSPDGTADYVRELQNKMDRINLIQRPGKMGLGSAYLLGFETAVDRGFGAVCTMDADQSHDPRYLAGMLTMLDDCDLVIGSRYVKGGAVENWNAMRKINSTVANILARRIVGKEIRDCTSGYRLYSTRLLQKLEFLALKSSGYSMLVELLYEARVVNARVMEHPILFKNRILGKSKISYLEVLGSLRTLFRLKLRQIAMRRRARVAVGHLDI